jgi:hypothetical protein
MHRRLQCDKRENPASDRRYGSRSTVTMDAPPNIIGKDRPSAATAVTIVDDSRSGSHVPAHAATNRAATRENRPEDQLLTVDEVATRLSVSRNWVYNHADAIGGYRLGKYLRFSWPSRLRKKSEIL